MKKNIHPQSNLVNVVCSTCGESYKVFTTLSHDFNIPVCCNCHPAYTGKSQIIIDVDNRISRFEARVKQSNAKQAKIEAIKQSKKEREAKRVGVVSSGEKLTLKDLLKNAINKNK